MPLNEILEPFDYDQESLTEQIHEIVATEARQPMFYAISGSHLYGFSSDESDLDVRGFHLSRKRWDMLDGPDEQVTLGQEAPGELDVVSYELRKFGKLLDKGNFNVIELYMDAPIVYDSPNAPMGRLVEKTRDKLPLDLPVHYRGMAKQNYHKYLERKDSDSYKPIAKKYLYVLRGLLAARYVVEENDITADIKELATMHDDAPEIVGELIDWKSRYGDTKIPMKLESESGKLARELLNKDPYLEDTEYNSEAWRSNIDEWMRTVRGLGA